MFRSLEQTAGFIIQLATLTTALCRIILSASFEKCWRLLKLWNESRRLIPLEPRPVADVLSKVQKPCECRIMSSLKNTSEYNLPSFQKGILLIMLYNKLGGCGKKYLFLFLQFESHDFFLRGRNLHFILPYKNVLMSLPSKYQTKGNLC